MKNILIILIATVFLLACDELVEEKAYSTLTTNGFFQTEEDILVGINGVYDGMQDAGWYISTLWMSDMMPGALGHYWSYQGWNTLNIYDSWNTYYDNWQIWLNSYEIIGRANVMLGALKGSSVDNNIKVQYEAEARFIRAYTYFVLVNTFGHVPVPTSSPNNLSEVLLSNTSSESDFYKQLDRNKIYEFLIEEFQFCEENLSSEYDGLNIGRATSWAAKGLLAKVYLAMAGKQYNYNTGELENGDDSYYGLCLEKLKEIINSGNFYLQEEFQNVFGGLYNNIYDNNNEILFAIQFVSTAEGGQEGEGSALVLRYGIRGANITPYAIKQARASDVFMYNFIQANGTDNPRYKATFITEYADADGDTVHWGESATFLKPHVRKLLSDYDYPNIESTGREDYGDDVIVLRYADILLMYSEVLNEMQGPSSMTLYGINLVRERAGLSDIELSVTQDELRDLIFDERKWELAYEGHYYFDCQRTGRLKEEIIKNWNSDEREITQDQVTNKFYLMPIPFTAMEENSSLQQNYGY
ncbi:MAG: RagB/SusD family nutrient uptake outer membrane protein [Draconibacterium sp.]